MSLNVMEAGASSSVDHDAEKALVSKVAWRLMPLIMVCYLFAFFDRINISFAKFQLQADLSLIERVFDNLIGNAPKHTPAGGCVRVELRDSGEHGVGVEKRDLMTVQFGPADLEAQLWVKDVFDPRWLLNPAKVFPLATSESRRAA